MISIGTSGWQYDSWRGAFYPSDLARTEWLRFYAQRFPTVEANNTFYRLPTVATVARWRAAATAGFVLAVKASRFITHRARDADLHEPVGLLLSRVRALGPALGPVLFQFPSTARADLTRLQDILDAIPRGTRAAFEFRDRSWRTDATLSMLHEAGAAIVLADPARRRGGDEVTGGWTYLRFHRGGVSRPGYTRRTLERWADRIAALSARDIYGYFNNDAGAAAVRDATTLTELLAARGMSQPVRRVAGG